MVSGCLILMFCGYSSLTSKKGRGICHSWLVLMNHVWFMAIAHLWFMVIEHSEPLLFIIMHQPFMAYGYQPSS